MKLSTLIFDACVLVLSASTIVNADWYFTTYTAKGCPIEEVGEAYSGTGNKSCTKFTSGVPALLIRPGSFAEDSNSYLEVWTGIDCKPPKDSDEVWFEDDEDVCHSSGDVTWGSFEVYIEPEDA